MTSGNTLLLRYANAGIQHHSIGVLGLHQAVLAADGSELPYPRTMVAETIAPGQSADVLVTLPATTAASTKYALYDAALTLNNSTASGIGGMLAFIDASGAAGGTDTVGPLTSGVSFTVATGALAATVSDASTGNANVAAGRVLHRHRRRRGDRQPDVGHVRHPDRRRQRDDPERRDRSPVQRYPHGLRPRPGRPQQLGRRRLGDVLDRQGRPDDVTRVLNPEPNERVR